MIRPIALVLMHLACASAYAADQNSARDLAAGCTVCHGVDGRAHGSMPSLAGRGRADIVQQLKEFKDGKRAGTIMPQIARGYSDEQFDAIAGYFTSTKR